MLGRRKTPGVPLPSLPGRATNGQFAPCFRSFGHSCRFGPSAFLRLFHQLNDFGGRRLWMNTCLGKTPIELELAFPGRIHSWETAKSRASRPTPGWSAILPLNATTGLSALWFDPDSIIHREADALLAGETSFCVWIETWPSRNCICSSSPPAVWHSLAQVLRRSCGANFSMADFAANSRTTCQTTFARTQAIQDRWFRLVEIREAQDRFGLGRRFLGKRLLAIVSGLLDHQMMMQQRT